MLLCWFCSYNALAALYAEKLHKVGDSPNGKAHGQKIERTKLLTWERNLLDLLGRNTQFDGSSKYLRYILIIPRCKQAFSWI